MRWLTVLSAVSWLTMSSAKPIAANRNSTFTNPMLPGWHSDPSCIFVPELDNTFFCATSTFLITPGIPIFASKDLVNWKLASHVLTRPEQAPYFNQSQDQNDGIFAPTLRYKNGKFYLITVYVFRVGGPGTQGLLFTSTDPFTDSSWSNPLVYPAFNIDPDIFWHPTDGKVYVTSSPIIQQTIDLSTDEVSEPYSVWNGTGGAWPEGPHIYFKDDYFYLLIGEGGTETNHSVTIAGSRDIAGPYESYEGNPILTAKGTDEYFQTVGHADLFEDANGNWWAVALATRSGPEWNNYPMGRETILTPVSWPEGEWPTIDPVKGQREVWPLPAPSRDVPRKGPFLGDPDIVDFTPGSTIPPHFSFWRWGVPESYTMSPPDHPNTLRLTPSRTISSTPTDPFAGKDGITLLLRLQEHTLFTYTVDMSYDPLVLGEEAGVTAFLTQQQHIDLSITLLPESTSTSTSNATLVPHLRLRATGTGTTSNSSLPLPILTSPIPESWLGSPIMLQVQAQYDTHYTFSAASSLAREESILIGGMPSTVVSGGTGPFTGSLVGVFATTNSNETDVEGAYAYVGRWRYTGDAQKVDDGVYIPSSSE